MPTTYTHYAYGQDVFNKLPEQIQKSIEPYMERFMSKLLPDMVL